jgi:hypothetical protein
MSFNLLKQLDELRDDELFIAESVFGIGDMLAEDKEILSENVKKFVAWARNLLDRPVVNVSQIERDPTVDATEAKPFDVKDEKDAFAKLARTIAGLIYFMNKNVDGHAKQMIANKVQGDKQIDKYVKSFGVDKAMDVINKVGADLKTKNRSYIKNLLTKIESYYQMNHA